MALRVYPQVGTIQHVHHAGNSSGIVDGAGAVLIASPEYARAHGLQPRARVRSLATAGAEPVIMTPAGCVEEKAGAKSRQRLLVSYQRPCYNAASQIWNVYSPVQRDGGHSAEEYHEPAHRLYGSRT